MIIKDTKGMYELNVDTKRNVVFEKVDGLWTAEDLERYQQDYMTKVKPAFKGNKWAKCSDLRTYRTSNISAEMNKLMSWCFQNGLACGAIIVDSAIVKMQMERSTRGAGGEPTPFANLEDADKWLKTQGF